MLLCINKTLLFLSTYENEAPTNNPNIKVIKTIAAMKSLKEVGSTLNIE